MWWLSVLVAYAGPITLGDGRAAVLKLDEAPSAVEVSSPSVLEVVPSMPYLVLIGKKAGTAVLTLDGAAGPVSLSVTVDRSSDVAPTGDGLVPAGETLSLLPDQGVLFTLDRAPLAHTLIDTRVAQLQAFKERTFFVQGLKSGVTDVIFEQDGQDPRILTVRVSAEGGDARPHGVTEPTETLEFPAGGDATIQIGKSVHAVLVGHPSRLHVERVEGASDQLYLQSLRAGTTTLLVHTGDDGDIWTRRVVMTPSSGQ